VFTQHVQAGGVEPVHVQEDAGLLDHKHLAAQTQQRYRVSALSAANGRQRHCTWALRGRTVVPVKLSLP
jgi:hypothetical protein